MPAMPAARGEGELAHSPTPRALSRPLRSCWYASAQQARPHPTTPEKYSCHREQRACTPHAASTPLPLLLLSSCPGTEAPSSTSLTDRHLHGG
ncbi:hypothetical protein T484DRAFT_1933264 [Baffinella frigidus]|nr:hypothetical protein T484DRAFT_1933264 [Cryptophyta sp. CCMP2293]